jgi:hypothetical protein
MQIIHTGGVTTLVALMAAHRAMTERLIADHAAAGAPPDLSRRQDRVRLALPGKRGTTAAAGPTALRRSCS